MLCSTFGLLVYWCWKHLIHVLKKGTTGANPHQSSWRRWEWRRFSDLNPLPLEMMGWKLSSLCNSDFMERMGVVPRNTLIQTGPRQYVILSTNRTHCGLILWKIRWTQKSLISVVENILHWFCMPHDVLYNVQSIFLHRSLKLFSNLPTLNPLRIKRKIQETLGVSLGFQDIHLPEWDQTAAHLGKRILIKLPKISLDK